MGLDIDKITEVQSVNIASLKNQIQVNAGKPQNYYDGLAKRWAVSENIIDGIDYSAKHYAEESKKTADLAAEKTTIAINKVDEVVESGNEALSKISAQETASKNAVKTEGETQVARVKAEGANYATKAEATYTAGNGISIENNVISNTQTSAEWGNIQGDIQSQNDLIEFVNSKGSGLELCDIGIALYIDETKGLRRRLNGSIMDITGNYQAFLTRLKEITTLYPSLVCTETEWQTTKTMSKLGQCGKFVYNYDTDGTTVTSIRLPLVININGLVDMASAGLIKDESLPDPNSELYSFWGSGSGTNGNQSLIAQNYSGSVQSTPSSGNTYIKVNNSTYQDNAPVQQEAIQYPYFIQVATGQETENNIVNDIELNNPYVLFKSEYFEAPPYNISWLKSDGEYKPKATYPKAYEALVIENNSSIAVGTTVDLPSGTKYTKRGLSVKLSSATDITDYDFVTNTTNETFRLPLKNGQEGVFASGVKGNGLTMGLTNGTYNLGIGSGQNNVAEFLTSFYGQNIPYTYTSGATPVPLNTAFGLTTDSSKSGIVVDTTVPSGWNLYYYVGETVQNANLIDAGRIAEELGNRISKSECKAYVVETYSNGSSWYRLWSDNWLEQGGLFKISNTSITNYTIEFIKPYSDVNYTVVVCGGAGKSVSQYVGFWCTNKNKNNMSMFLNSSDASVLTSWMVCGYAP